jgi:hypothetical protein
MAFFGLLSPSSSATSSFRALVAIFRRDDLLLSVSDFMILAGQKIVRDGSFTVVVNRWVSECVRGVGTKAEEDARSRSGNIMRDLKKMVLCVNTIGTLATLFLNGTEDLPYWSFVSSINIRLERFQRTQRILKIVSVF